MAIFSKNKKNKKDGSRNSVIPKSLEAVKDGIIEDNNTSQRQVSGASTISSTNSLMSGQSVNAPSKVNTFPGANQQGPYPTRPSGGISPQNMNNSRSNSAMSGQIPGPNSNGVRSPLGLRSATSPSGQQYPGGNQWGSQGGHPQQPRQPLHHQQSVPTALRSSPQIQTQSPHPSTQPQYPWSRHHISNSSPFPRHGHAANAIAARDGEVFVMGGLKGSNVFGDLWVIETDSLAGFRLETEGCPSPRVGHASLTLGNAFVVFGGDTKIEETDILDDELYLLNTTTLKWTVANSTGLRPAGRYGHTLSTIGSQVYVFGGQVDDYFYNDLMCYDLTTLRSANAQWNLINPVNNITPPPRTNHTIITYQDKLYLFGGTDGKLWYSDTWCFDPAENSWTSLDCSGFIPAPCEGHAATIVGDIMYVFGGRSSQGKDLGTLSALKLTTKKWFTFQNLGPGPSPRSGHSMTAFSGHKILVMGGECAQMVGFDNNESPNYEGYDSTPQLSNIFVLDTLRINYPTDSDTGIDQQVPSGRSGDSRSASAASGTLQGGIVGGSSSPSSLSTPSTGHGISGAGAAAAGVGIAGGALGAAAGIAAGAMAASAGVTAGSIAAATGSSPATGYRSSSNSPHLNSPYEQKSSSPRLVEYPISKSPQNLPSSRSPPPYRSSQEYQHPQQQQQQQPQQPQQLTRSPQKFDQYNEDISDTKSNTTFESIDEEGFKQNDHLTNIPGAWQHVSSPSSTNSIDDEPINPPKVRASPRIDTSVKGLSGIGNSPDDNTPTPTLAHPHDESMDSTLSHHPQDESLESFSAPVVLDQSTPRGSQVHLSSNGNGTVDNVSQVIEQLKASNSWYESELNAAREAGYVSKSSPPVDILKLRRVSQRLTQDNHESLSERDILITALSELKDELRNVQNDIQNQAEAASNRILAVEKERDEVINELNELKAQGGGVGGSNRDINDESGDHDQTIINLQKELEEVKASRSLLLSDTDSLSTIDELKLTNAQLEQQVRLQADRIVVFEHENSQFKSKIDDLQGSHIQLTSSTAEKVAALAAAGAAITAAQHKSNELSKQLEEHRKIREDLESKVRNLESELLEHKEKSENSQKELSNCRSLLESAQEQNEHSSKALGDGIDKIVSMWSGSRFFKGAALGVAGAGIGAVAGAAVGAAAGNDGSREIEEEDPRIIDLQNQLDLANKLHNTHREAADSATDKLTATLGQVSGLKKELGESESNNNHLKSQLQALQEELETTKQQLQSHKDLLDDHKKSLNELSEQHSSAKESDEKLEQYKAEADERYNELQSQYNETLQYVRNSDKALSKTRDELNKHKELSSKLQEEINDLKLRTQQDDEEGEKSMNSVGSSYNKHFDLQLRDLKTQLIILQEERDELRASSLELKKRAINNSHDLEDARSESTRLGEENSKLLQRAKEAEDKLSVLLHSKRNSRDPIIDPESGQTLDSFSNDLEKIRNERERLSGLLRESPTGEEE